MDNKQQQEGGVVIEDGILLDYNGLAEEYVIPADVTAIAEEAFYYCQNLRSITISNSVTSIGESAFEGCINLTIHCPSGSYAERYVINNSIQYVIE